MAFKRNALLHLISISSAVYCASAFGLVATSKNQVELRQKCFTRQLPRFQPPSVSLSSVDDIVASEDDSEEESPEEDEFIVSAEDLEVSDEELPELDASASFMHAERLRETRLKYKRTENDSGSPEFQVAGMTERIKYLTTHMKENPKDFSTRRGLVALVNKRRRLLNFLAREDVNRYVEIVSSLGIRHRAPGRVTSKEEQYGRFPKQKKPRKSGKH